LRTRLIAVFVLATVVPLGLTLWTTLQLLNRSLDLAPDEELRVTHRPDRERAADDAALTLTPN